MPGQTESAAWDWFWGFVESSMRWTMDAYEQVGLQALRVDRKGTRNLIFWCGVKTHRVRYNRHVERERGGGR